MRTVPVMLGEFVANRRPPLPTHVDGRALLRSCLFYLGVMALLAAVSAVFSP